MNDAARVTQAGQGPDAGHRHHDEAAWEAFSSPSDGLAFIAAWFRLVVANLPNPESALLMLEQGGSFVTAARFPQDGKPEVFEPLLKLAGRARPDQAETMIEVCDTGGRLFGYPVTLDGKLRALVIWSSAKGNPAGGVEAAMRRLHWGAGWLQVMLLHQQNAGVEASRARMAAVLDLLAAMEDEAGLDASLRALVDGAADRFNADRAAIFLLRRGRLRLGALSGVVGPERRAGDLASLAAAAEESRLQDRPLVLPAVEDGLAIIAAHRAHARRTGVKSLLSLPLRVRGKVIGCLTLERVEGADFTQDEVILGEAIASGAAATLVPRISEHRWVSGRLRWHMGRFLRRVFGPHRPALKLGMLIAAGLVLVLAFLPVPLRISARATIQGAEERLVSAPFDGYVAQAFKRAGDRVEKGETLALMADEDLRLDLLAARGEVVALEQQARAAMAKGERATRAEAEARIAEARARMALIEARLARTTLTAPLSGVVVEGDLSQNLGAPVATGDSLFRLAAGHGYRAEIEVSEYDIGAVTEGLPGVLALAGLSGAAIPVRVERIGPVSDISERGQNMFRAEASLPADQTARLRPGLEGVVKIEAGRAPLGQVLLRPLLLRAKFLLWRWTP